MLDISECDGQRCGGQCESCWGTPRCAISWHNVDPTVMPARPTGESFTFGYLKSAEQRKWVVDHPGHIEDWDSMGRTVLYAAARRKDLALVKWLVDTQGSDVNGCTKKGYTAYEFADKCPLIARALQERGAKPAINTYFSLYNIRQYVEDYPGHVDDRDRRGMICTSPREDTQNLKKIWPSSNG